MVRYSDLTYVNRCPGGYLLKKIIQRFLNASIAAKLIGFSATLLMIVIAFESIGVVYMQKKAAVHEARLFADGMEKMALSGLTTMMITGQMQHRDLLLGQINETGIVRDLRIIRSKKVTAVFGEGKNTEKSKYAFEERVIETGEPYFKEEEGDSLRIVKPIRAQANYLGKNCLGCHQAQQNEILGAITMQISLSEVTEQSRQFSLQIMGAGLLIVAILIGGLLLLSRFIISNPLDRLLLLFRRLQQKDYTEKVVPQYRDEVGRLNEGVGTFLQYSIELLTKLGKISGQLSGLAGKTRETSENFLRLSERQATVIEETSATIQELNASLMTEKEELRQFLEMVSRTANYAVNWGDTYRNISSTDQAFRKAYEDNSHKFKKVHKRLAEVMADADQLFNEKTTGAASGDAAQVQALHRLIAELNGVAVLLKQAVLSHLKAGDSFLQSRAKMDEIASSIDASEQEIRKMTDIHGQIVEEYNAQTEASGEISKTINLLAAEAAATAATAADMAQMANEASRLALLLKDLLHEFRLPN